ncbi:MAG: hypothetical protein V2A62_03480 [Candidatus Woesearchaeota archaeon]
MSYHPLEAGLEKCLQREDLVWKGPFRSAFYGFGRFRPTVSVTRSLIYLAAPVKGCFRYKKLQNDLRPTLLSLIPNLNNFPEGSWKQEYFRVGVGVATVTCNVPVQEVEFSPEEYCIEPFKQDDKPHDTFNPGTKFIPDSLQYGGAIFLYPHQEFLERSWQECFKSNPIDTITREELEQVQRKYAPTLWQKLQKLL